MMKHCIMHSGWKTQLLLCAGHKRTALLKADYINTNLEICFFFRMLLERKHRSSDKPLPLPLPLCFRGWSEFFQVQCESRCRSSSVCNYCRSDCFSLKGCIQALELRLFQTNECSEKQIQGLCVLWMLISMISLIRTFSHTHTHTHTLSQGNYINSKQSTEVYRLSNYSINVVIMLSNLKSGDIVSVPDYLQSALSLQLHTWIIYYLLFCLFFCCHSLLLREWAQQIYAWLLIVQSLTHKVLISTQQNRSAELQTINHW